MISKSLLVAVFIPFVAAAQWMNWSIVRIDSATNPQEIRIAKPDSADVDCADLRFVTRRGQRCRYWIEDCTNDSVFAHVKHPDSVWHHGDSLYLVMNKSGAADSADIFHTFRFGEDWAHGPAALSHSHWHDTVSVNANDYEAHGLVVRSIVLDSHYAVYGCAIDSNAHSTTTTRGVYVRVSGDVNSSDNPTWGDSLEIYNCDSTDDGNIAVGVYTYADTEYVGVAVLGLDTHETQDSRSYFLRARTSDLDFGAYDTVSLLAAEDSIRTPKGHIVQLSDGRIVIPTYHWLGPNVYWIVTYHSTDGGATWTEHIGNTDTTAFHSEWDLIERKTNGVYAGRMYGVVRRDASPLVHRWIYSEDYGETWAWGGSWQDQIVGGTIPACAVPVLLVRMADSCVYASTSNNVNGQMYVYRSCDECSTWTLLRWGKTATYGKSLYATMCQTDLPWRGYVLWCTNGHTPPESDQLGQWFDIQRDGPRWYHNGDTVYSTTEDTLKDRPDVDETVYIRTWQKFCGIDSPLTCKIRLKQNDMRVVGFCTGAEYATPTETNGIYIRSYPGYNYLRAINNSDNWYWWSAGGDTYQNQWATYRFDWTDTKVSLWLADTLRKTKTADSANGIPDDTLAFYLYTASSDAAQDFQMDWIYVRDYAAHNPRVTTVAEGVPGTWYYDPSDSSFSVHRKRRHTLSRALNTGASLAFSLYSNTTGKRQTEAITNLAYVAAIMDTSGAGDTLGYSDSLSVDSLSHVTSGVWLLHLSTANMSPATDHNELLRIQVTGDNIITTDTFDVRLVD